MPMRMPKFRFTRRVGKILLSIVAVALLLCGVAAWQVPKVLRSVLTEDVSKMLGRDVSVGKISFNPFTLTVRARDLAIAQPGSETPLLTLAELDASAAWSSLFWFAPVVDRLTLREPKIAIVREDVTRFNFSDVQQRVAEMSAAKPEEPPKPDEGLPRFSQQHAHRGRLGHAGRQGHRPQAGGGRVHAGRAVHLHLRLCHGHRRAATAAPAHQRQPLRPDRRGAALREGAVLDAERDLLRPAAGEVGRRVAHAAAVRWSARCSIRTCAWCSSSRMRRPRSGWWATWACASSTCATSRAPSWRPGAR